MAKATADREHRRVIRAQNAITAALRKQSKKWFGISGVIGFAVGGTYPDLTATFILDGNLSATKRKKVQKQLPRFIKLKTKRVPTEFAALGTVKLTADIGDPTANRVDYVNNGVGPWEMGARIKVFPQTGNSVIGTAGCLVVDKAATDPKPQLVLSAAHVLKAKGNKVAQWRKNADPPPAGKQHNYVGVVRNVSPQPAVDGGVIEEVLGPPKKEIINIGAPKAYQTVENGSYIRKSGGTTGLTYSRILFTADKQLDAKTAQGVLTLAGPLYLARNVCEQQPPKPDSLKEDPGITAPPADLFLFEGDSGGLAVLGLPGTNDVFGGPGLDERMQTASEADRKDTINRFYGAAVGLVIAKAPVTLKIGGAEIETEVAIIQDIKLILDTLKVDMLVA